jgi:drug/metabolite transporter (DMT)-like permease
MRKKSLAVAAALALTLGAWGLSYVWTKIVLDEMGPFTLVFVRFFLATGLFALSFVLTGRRPLRLSPADHGRMLGLALLQPVGHFAFETCGLRLTSASSAALIVAAIPLAVMALGAASGRERLTAGNCGRILLSVAGVACIMAGPALGAGNGEPTGDLLMLGAVLSTAGYVVLGGGLTRRLDALTVPFLQLAWGAVLFFPGCVWEMYSRGWPAVSPRGAAALGALTVLASFAAFACYNYVLGRLPATRAALWLNAVPLITAVAAWEMLGERLGPWQGLGGGLVVLAAAAPGRRRPAKAPKRTEKAASAPVSP